MTRRHRPLTTLALAALVGAAPLALPAAADAQGNGRQHRQDRGKAKGHMQMPRVARGPAERRDAPRLVRDRNRRDDDRRRWTSGPARPRSSRPTSYAVPPGHRPPPGLCRVWVAGVPPGRQPAPTSCARALRSRPANAQILWGPGTERYRTRSSSHGGAPLWRRDDRRVDRRDDWRAGGCVDVDRDGRIERRRVVTAGGVVRTVCR